jgi:multimeric flavodoxin WrbA
MQVTLINGQNHKGSTYHIGRMLAEKLTSDDKITEIFLPRDMDDFCTGCGQCFLESETKCPHYQKLKPLTDAMDNSNVLLFTSPVYVYHATGSMKAFLDHYGYRWMVHRPVSAMFHKQAVVIATAAGGGMKSTIKDISHSCFYWGIPKIYKYGLAVRAIRWQEVTPERRRKIDQKTTALAKAIRQNNGHVTAGPKTKLYFHVMRKLQKSVMQNPSDLTYWSEKGWLGKTRPWQ